MPQRVAQMHDERVEIIGQASGGGLIAGLVELADQRFQALLAVADAGRLIEYVPVRHADAFAFCFGELGQ